MSRRTQPQKWYQTSRRGRRSRSSFPRRWFSPGSVFGGLAALLSAGFFAIERFPDYLGPLPGLTALKTVAGSVTHVRDGDTIEVAGTPIRFGSLDCAERDTKEGQAASARMRELVSDRNLTLTCALNGRSSHDRKIGSCRLPDGQDLAAIMIREGRCGRFW